MSGRYILLTGPPGIGKTTVIRKTIDLLKDKNVKFQGFFTEEVKVGRERIGFDIITTFGQRGVLARISDSGTRCLPRVGKYAVDVPSFETLALPVFDCDASTVLILDEIGKMELFSKVFLEKSQSAFAKDDIKILATIPIARRALPFVDALRARKDCILIEVTRENRNSLANELVQILTKT